MILADSLAESLKEKRKNFTKPQRDQRWRVLGWPRDYDPLWREVQRLEKRGGDEALLRAWKLQRDLFLGDLWALSYFGLDYRDIGNEFHWEFCDKIQELDPFHWDGINRAFLVPRDHLKSSLGTVAGAIRLILKYPWIRIPIFSGKKDEANNQYRKIKGNLEGNKYLQRLFPDVLYEDPLKEKAERWSEDKLKVRQDRFPEKRYYQAEPTVQALGVEGLETGPHYDLAIFDDAENKENSETITMVEKTKEAIRSVVANLERSRPMMLFGTPHAWNGYHIEILRGWRDARRHGGKSLWQVYNRGLRYKENEDWPLPPGAKVGEYIFPKTKYCRGFDEEEEERKKQSMSWKQFAAQYWMMPVAPGETSFDLNDLRYYQFIRREGRLYTLLTYAKRMDGSRIEERQMTIPLNMYVLVDLAISQTKRADYTVITPVGVGPGGMWFVFPYVRGKFRTSAMIPKLLATLRNPDVTPVSKLHIEGENIALAVYEFVFAAVKKEFPKIIMSAPFKPKGNKHGRIEGALGPKLQANRIYIRENMSVLETEFALHPQETVTDDILDTLANVKRVAETPNEPIQETVAERVVRETVEFWTEYGESHGDPGPSPIPELVTNELHIPGYV